MPTVFLTSYFSLGVGGVVVLIVFALIGERLFRPWKRLWKVPDTDKGAES